MPNDVLRTKKPSHERQQTAPNEAVQPSTGSREASVCALRRQPTRWMVRSLEGRVYELNLSDIRELNIHEHMTSS